MISIRRPDSKELNFLPFLTAFGFVLLCHSLTSGELCNRVSNQILCYFEDAMDWDAAWHLCESRNATLPVIRNRSEQAAFEQFLRAHMPGSKAWTSGKSHRYAELTWFDGRKFSEEDSLLETHIYELNDSKVQVKRHPNMDENPRDRYRYICQYSGPLCNFFNDTYEVKDGCIRRSDDERSWYDARNQCLATGGDLAVLDDNVVDEREYIFLLSCLWMGYRKVSYRWNVDKNASEEDDIKFTNWSEDFDLLTGDCVSINASDGKWRAIGCSEKQRVICQVLDRSLDSVTRGTELVTSGQSSRIGSLSDKSVTSSYATAKSTILGRQTGQSLTSSTHVPMAFRDTTAASGMLGKKTSDSQTSSTHVSMTFQFTFILVGIIILLVSNVTVAVIVRSYMKRKANSAFSCGTQSNVGYQIFRPTTSNSHDAELQLIPDHDEFERDCSNSEAS